MLRKHPLRSMQRGSLRRHSSKITTGNIKQQGGCASTGYRKEKSYTAYHLCLT